MEAGMKRSVRAAVMMLALVGATIVNAQRVDDPRVADLVRTGKLRVALFLPQYTKDPVNGVVRGEVHLVDIARALAARMGVELVLVEYPTPPAAMEGLNTGSCDVAFLGINPARAAVVGLSPPFVEMDYTLLVPAGSSIRKVANADRPGVQIAGVRNHASTSALARLLKDAKIVYAETPDPAFDLLRTGKADAWASVGFVLESYSSRLPGSRVLEDRYGASQEAMAVRKDQAGRLAYISEFIEEAKASGVVQRAIERGGLRGIHVAAPVNSKAEK